MKFPIGLWEVEEVERLLLGLGRFVVHADLGTKFLEAC